MAWRQPIVATMALLSLCGGAAAQAPSKVFKIGFLIASPWDSRFFEPAITRAFADRGYILGTNLAFDIKAASGKLELLPALADELVADHVDLIMTRGYPSAVAAKERAAAVPVVVSGSGDPVATHLVMSLARPGANLTGVSEIAADLSAKRLQILKEAIPSLRTVAVLWNADDLAMTLRYNSSRDEATKLGVAIQPLGVHAPNDFAVAFAAMVRDPPDAIMMLTDALTILNRKRVVDFAAEHRIPAIFEGDSLVREGGLMSYGPDGAALLNRAVGLADRVLKGASPADLPLELPTKFVFAINLKAAKALGLDLPESIVLRADQVVE
ncbi:MAG TPA: ABC transporter substrate-binding protein [Roseiarcus sp.]|jgi:putative tryptophan/tyrosine transport system substrate-binding protein